MKISWKLSEKDKEKIKQLRAEGRTIRDVAARFGVSTSTIAYVQSQKIRESSARKAKRWVKANPERAKAIKHKYYTKHHELYYPSVCLSIMKKCLREGWLTKERIIKTIQEVEK